MIENGESTSVAKPSTESDQAHIDSADAMCLRIQDGVNLLCRGMVLGQILENATIYLRLPYSRTLYLISTGGAEYDR